MSLSAAIAILSTLFVAGIARGSEAQPRAESLPSAEPIRDPRQEEMLRTLLDARGASLDPQQTMEAILLVRRLGTQGAVWAAPTLWAVADQSSEGVMGLVALEALDALWRLGEPAQEFVARLGSLDRTPELARLSSLVLGRSTLPEHQRAVESLCQAAEEGRVDRPQAFRWTLVRARMANRLAARLVDAADVRQQVDLLAPMTLRDYSPLMSHCTGVEAPQTRADPVVALARARLFELSRRAPVETAAALLASEMGGHLTADLVPDESTRQRFLEGFRDHAALHMAPEAMAQYALHRPEAFEHGPHD